MKKLIRNKKSIVLTLAFLVAFAAIFCCCLKGEAQAETDHLATQANSHCHSEDQQNANPTSSDDCDCPHTLDVILESNNSDVLKTQLSFTKNFKQAISYFEKIAWIDQNQLLFSKHSPPILSQHSIPIYLQISVLRI